MYPTFCVRKAGHFTFDSLKINTKTKNTNYRRVISVHVFFCAISVASFQRISFTFNGMDSSNFFEFGGSPVRASIYVLLFLFLDLPVLFTPPTSAA